MNGIPSATCRINATYMLGAGALCRVADIPLVRSNGNGPLPERLRQWSIASGSESHL